MGQETFVFKAFLQDVLSPGYPMYICAPESCCAPVEQEKSATTAAHMLCEMTIFKCRDGRSVGTCGETITAVFDATGPILRRLKRLVEKLLYYKV